jgi:hypothetical protein
MPSVQSGNDGPSFRDSRADGSKASAGVGGVGLLGRQRQAGEGEPRIHGEMKLQLPLDSHSAAFIC